LAERGNGCYIDLYEADTTGSSQYLLTAEAVFRSLDVLPVSDDLQLRLGQILDNAIGSVEDGPDADEPLAADAEYDEKLMGYIKSNWRDDDPGIIHDVAQQLAVANGLMLCNREHELFTLGEWARPTGSYVNTISDDSANQCPNCGAPKSEYWKCTRKSRRTRVPNRYKCTNCGTMKSGITTG
jgi:predicted RNA-binding Zn-ribbon protein involved in translation (DUF1610 family)